MLSCQDYQMPQLLIVPQYPIANLFESTQNYQYQVCGLDFQDWIYRHHQHIQW